MITIFTDISLSTTMQPTIQWHHSYINRLLKCKERLHVSAQQIRSSLMAWKPRLFINYIAHMISVQSQQYKIIFLCARLKLREPLIHSCIIALLKKAAVTHPFGLYLICKHWTLRHRIYKIRYKPHKCVITSKLIHSKSSHHNKLESSLPNGLLPYKQVIGMENFLSQ